MNDPTIISTLIKAGSGAMGASIVSLFWRPKPLSKLSLWLSGVITGMVGAFFAIMFTGFTVDRLGLDHKNIEHIMALAGLLGMLSLGFAGWIANFMAAREGRDIKEVTDEISGR